MGLEVYSGVLQDSLCSCMFKKSAESVGKRALKVATEVGQDVPDFKNFKESTRSRGEVFKDLHWQIKEQMLYNIRLEEKRREC